MNVMLNAETLLAGLGQDAISGALKHCFEARPMQ